MNLLSLIGLDNERVTSMKMPLLCEAKEVICNALGSLYVEDIKKSQGPSGLATSSVRLVGEHQLNRLLERLWFGSVYVQKFDFSKPEIHVKVSHNHSLFNVLKSGNRLLGI